MIALPQKSAHYYRVTGNKVEPFYEIAKKDGTGMRSPTIRDARELGLVPSVTTIMQILSKPGLENWKMSQAILSALTLPRQQDEPLDVFTRHVLEDMDAESSKARDFGTAIHNAIELWLTQHRIEDKATEPYLAYFRDWGDMQVESILDCEFYVAGDGYAGRVDMLAQVKGIGLAVIDFKSQKCKGDKPTWYPEFGVQLAAYKAAIGKDAALLSVVINSTKPGPVWVHQWTDPEPLFDAFRHMQAIWRWQNGI